MYLQAVSVGYAVPHNSFDAVVHSVFRSALNLKPVGDNQLLTVLASEEGDLPQGIRVQPPGSFSFEELPEARRAACRDGILSLDGCSFAIDLRRAPRWESHLSDLRVDIGDPPVWAAWQDAWEALNNWQLRQGSGILASQFLAEDTRDLAVWVQRAGRSMREMLASTAGCQAGATRALEALVGLGPGLTPAGDDLLVGYLIGLWCTTRAQPLRLRFLADLGKAVVGLSERTNDISRTYLFHAARGQASSLIINLARAVCAGVDRTRVFECANAAMQVGHTSGGDSITGLLLGLAAWDGSVLH